jgi:cytidylate kinase
LVKWRKRRASGKSQGDRFRRYYSYDLANLAIYDVVLNTALADADGVANILKNVVEAYLVER